VPWQEETGNTMIYRDKLGGIGETIGGEGGAIFFDESLQVHANILQQQEKIRKHSAKTQNLLRLF